ncbi:MAG: undecaprenyl/decaprenyl-phosphate alpha-N-acetylglucosaminyl 1-phosphate transferase, partial [Phycisphaerae bacterium]|nr:undecaprenyl/decaprenyl-phosphate alpha-N-acetylglucosaminyl 1-phosphate transferase [Phycisphaerae bacterium]
MRTYFFTYLCSFLLTMVTTPLTIWFARKFNIMDRISARKVHSLPTPRIGGVVIFISTVILKAGVL